jgi:23S rRNA pseudouridine2605 synthase
MRLNKYIAQSGICSRRNADILIQSGRVTVNDIPVDKLGTSVDETKDRVAVDGQNIVRGDKHVYILLNKPPGYLSTVKDSFHRPTVMDLVGKEKKVFPVGRLDLDTEGVLLLTNDGELTYRLTHPKFEIEKTYLVTVEGEIDKKILEEFGRGIKLEDGITATGEGKIIKAGRGESTFELTLKEGRKREIKRMCHQAGLKVLHLVRVKFALLTAKGLKIGQWRPLTGKEVAQLKKLSGLV